MMVTSPTKNVRITNLKHLLDTLKSSNSFQIGDTRYEMDVDTSELENFIALSAIDQSRILSFQQLESINESPTMKKMKSSNLEQVISELDSKYSSEKNKYENLMISKKQSSMPQCISCKSANTAICYTCHTTIIQQVQSTSQNSQMTKIAAAAADADDK